MAGCSPLRLNQCLFSSVSLPGSVLGAGSAERNCVVSLLSLASLRLRSEHFAALCSSFHEANAGSPVSGHCGQVNLHVWPHGQQPTLPPSQPQVLLDGQHQLLAPILAHDTGALAGQDAGTAGEPSCPEVVIW